MTPKDYQKFVDHFNAQTHGLKPFIVKPVASSRGNGIFIVQSVGFFAFSFLYFSLNQIKSKDVMK